MPRQSPNTRIAHGSPGPYGAENQRRWMPSRFPPPEVIHPMHRKCWLKIEKCNGCKLPRLPKLVRKVPKDEVITRKRGSSPLDSG